MAPPSDNSPSGHSAIAIQAIPSPSTAQPTAQAAQGVGTSALLSNAPFTGRADANESGQGPLNNTANTPEQVLEQEPLPPHPAPRAAIRDVFASPSPRAQSLPSEINNSRFFDGIAIRGKSDCTLLPPNIPFHQAKIG